jgi:hypothetical protein
MPTRRLLGWLAVVAAALAVAVPAASASATTTAPAARTAHFGLPGFGGGFPVGGSSLTCLFLQGQLIGAVHTGQLALANALANTVIYLCPNPAI